jgi:hypothetical protein
MKNLLVTLLLLVLLIGNSHSQTNGIPIELINRKWDRTVEKHQRTYSLEFKSDSSVIFTNPANDNSPKIKFRFNNGDITFPAIGCTVEGEYKFTIIGNELTFQSENDSCMDRKDVMEGIWITTDKIK